VLIVETLNRLLLLYVACGLAFGAAFVTWGVTTVDAAARGAPLAFRLIILPGVVALWPVLALRWARAMRKGEGR
jgi:hypothetical protein